MFYIPILVAASAALAQSTIDSYIAMEEPIAKAGLLANIGPDGSKSSGAAVRSLPNFESIESAG
jgi:hypothetical protein